MNHVNWQDSGKPDVVECARFYQITDDNSIGPAYYFDPETGTMWAESTNDSGDATWESSIQTFPHGVTRP